MAPKRHLPSQRNPLLHPDQTPTHNVLIGRRRLGQTDLTVRSEDEGVIHDTKAENLEKFDYAHLRVPLPAKLEGTDLFQTLKNGLYPDSYFLMRRSSDGYISATGMFKAVFPWARVSEEETEKKYHKHFSSSAGSQEVAGNVWIAPEHALELAKEYNILAWIVALLDPAVIEKGSKDKHPGEIAMPPKFVVSDKDKSQTPQSSNRSRALRSSSPSKGSPRKKASPKKQSSRATSAKAETQAATENVVKAAKAMQEKLGNGFPPNANGSADGDVVRVNVQEATQKKGEIETTQTSVTIDMPASNPDLPIPKSAEEIVATAKEMVEEAHKLEKEKPKSKKSKRKADTLEDSKGEGSSSPAAKRAKTSLATQLKSERVKTRALIGLTATLAIGAIVPYFL